ncbi:hypothetical protein [uncultured Kordia sp.]|uniref:hypothetical protein n=1 Tax=uncultured Kordia sp. TaxID=507699 RepID=UPI00262853BF|nr:hypothetical protein [uncultured Kordia sp.]
MKKRIFLLLIICIANLTSYAQESNNHPKLLAAFKAQNSLNLETSRELFSALLKETNVSKKDRCIALRKLSLQDWKFYKDYNQAKKRLMEAIQIGDYVSESYVVLNRIESEAHNYSNALVAAEKSLETATSASDSTYATYLYSKTILKEATNVTLQQKPIDTSKLRKASTLLQKILAKNPTHVNAAEVLLGVSLLLKDGSLALKSWLAYYRFVDVNAAYSYLKEPAKLLSLELPMWNSETSNFQRTKAIIVSLANSRFYDFAKLVALRENDSIQAKIKADSEIQDIIHYTNYLKKLKDTTDEYYRLSAIEKNEDENTKNREAFISNFRVTNDNLMNTLSIFKKKSSEYSIREFREKLRTHFGTVQIIASTSSSSTLGMIMGHIVNERTETIKQYNHESDFTFTEIDMMVSNGYPSWFWEDRGAGGFAVEDGFLRVKQLFKSLPINAWQRITDPVKRGKIEKEIAEKLFSNSTDEKTIFSGLSQKLELDALNDLYNTLKTQGYTGIQLQLKFIEMYEAYRDRATMFAHEGRHSLDKKVLKDNYRALGSTVIEYRGRLSQIVFSNEPRLELANMIDGVNNSPTGMSNKMIVDVAKEWILKNHSEIKNYDATQIPISQLYKLSNAQIIACYKAVDPFYIDSKK